MSTPFPQAVLDQAARDAAANKPLNLLDKWKKRIMQMPGFQKPAPAPTSSQAQAARDAKAGGDAIRKLNGGNQVLNTIRKGATAASAANPYALAGTAIVSDITSRGVADGTLKGKPGVPTQPVGPAPTIEPANRPRGPMFMDPVGPSREVPGASSFMDPVAPPKADFRQLATTPERQSESDVALVPDSTVYSGRDDSRMGPTGVPQKGTNMSRSFNDLLAAVNNQRYGGFNSSQLPETAGNPFSATDPKTQSFDTDAFSYTGNSLANYGGDGSEAFAQSRERTDRDTFNPNAARIEGGSSRKSGGSLEEALADTAGINSYMSKFSSGDRERAARSAFLNDGDSYQGLKARDAVNRVVYAGGQHYIDGGEGNPAIRVKKPQQARDIASGKQTAAGLLDIYKSQITESKKGSTPVEHQAPAYLEQGARDGAFQQDKPMFSGSTPAIGGAVEFDINNDQTLPTFGAPKGYKPQSAYKDPVFPNPFLK